MSKLKGSISAWIVFERPADHPEHFVVRCFNITPGKQATPQPTCYLAETIHEARAKVPRGLHKIPRQEGDAPWVVETWM